MTRWSHHTADEYRRLGPQRHLEVLVPSILEAAGPVGGLEALDFGCGPGRVAAALLEAGAGTVVAVDQSPEMVAEARRTLEGLGGCRGSWHVVLADEGVLPVAPARDLVVCSLALMMCGSRRRLHLVTAGLLRSVRRPGGRAVIVVTHPCFRWRGFETFHYRLPDGYDYWSSGTPYEVVLTPPGEPRPAAVITDHHWMLTDYVDSVRSAGGVITALRELPAVASDAAAGPPAYLLLVVSPSSSPTTSGR